MELGRQEAQLPPLSASELAAPLPVFRLKKLLVPIDFSECSRKALQYAIPLARQFDAELHLLHVVAAYPPIPEMASVDIETIHDANVELAALRDRIRHLVPCVILIRPGEPGAEIVAAARESGSDLIVLSTHGRTGIARMLQGSVAERVLRHATCPILVVREHEQEFISGDALNSMRAGPG